MASWRELLTVERANEAVGKHLVQEIHAKETEWHDEPCVELSVVLDPVYDSQWRKIGPLTRPLTSWMRVEARKAEPWIRVFTSICTHEDWVLPDVEEVDAGGRRAASATAEAGPPDRGVGEGPTERRRPRAGLVHQLVSVNGNRATWVGSGARRGARRAPGLRTRRADGTSVRCATTPANASAARSAWTAMITRKPEPTS